MVLRNKMYSRVEIYKVLVVLGVWLSAGMAQDGAACTGESDGTDTVTVNCSRHSLSAVPERWPEDLPLIGPNSQVLVTFLNNTISVLTEVPSIGGAKVALNFRANQIIDIHENAFKNLKNLYYLDLRNNSITGEVLRSEIFQGPYENGVYGNIGLEVLYLSHNEIHSLDRNLFKYAPNLTLLCLNDNPIEILDHVTISALAAATNLQILDLADTKIDSIPMDTFKTLKRLRQLDLSGNRFVTVPDSLSLVGASLKILNFNNNPILELNDDSFMGLTNLINLEVGQNEYLEEIKRSTFTPLKSLSTLHLCHNRNLRYINHNAFRGLKDKWTLKEVYLDDNNLSELPTDLMPWNKLDTIGMSGNNWLCNCDLANIVTKKGAGKKFKAGEIPYCVAPMRWSGLYITNVTLELCPTFDTTFAPKKTFTISDLKPKHVLWSIFGVAMIVLAGMILGLLVNTMKACYKNNVRTQPIRYANLNEDSSFA